MSNTPSKLAEAKKLISNFPKRIDAAFEHIIIDQEIMNDFTSHFLGLFREVIKAQDLISYERGREEQKEKDMDIINNITPSSKRWRVQSELIDYIYSLIKTQKYD